MGMNINLREESGEVVIKGSGRFDFESHQDFGEALKAANCHDYNKFVVDMSSVEDLDSSALGMLLLLRESAGGEKSDVSIVNCKNKI